MSVDRWVCNFGSTDPVPQSNYYLRSSVTGAVLTETDHTGRKLKTFVPASGATVAEQEMVTIGGTTTEKLTFIHQDPSLAGLERTDRNGNVANLRAGEYDALGRNVADAGPYVTLDTSPPAGDQGSSGINLDGSAQGYRPGRMNYFADGLPVPEDYFWSKLSGLGSFGLLEHKKLRLLVSSMSYEDDDGRNITTYWTDWLFGVDLVGAFRSPGQAQPVRRPDYDCPPGPTVCQNEINRNAAREGGRAWAKREAEQREKFLDCFRREMADVKRQLNDLMNRNLSKWKRSVGVGLIVGLAGTNPALGASAASCISLGEWFDELEKFNSATYEPQRLASINKCRAEAGYRGRI